MPSEEKADTGLSLARLTTQKGDKDVRESNAFTERDLDGLLGRGIGTAAGNADARNRRRPKHC